MSTSHAHRAELHQYFDEQLELALIGEFGEAYTRPSIDRTLPRRLGYR
jgi:hypothetical protein